MSSSRKSALFGLAAMGLWLMTTGSASAGQLDFVSSTVSAMTPTVVVGSGAGTGNVSDDCTFRGIKLAGKVKVVDSFPDVRVKIVRSFPDLRVKKVESFADECGEWQFVDSFADFTIQYVDQFADVEAVFVEHNPGTDQH